MYVQCVQSRNIKGKKKKEKSEGSNLEIPSVSATESKWERNESCHFGHPPGLLVKGKICPQRERDLFDSWLSHTLLNRRPIALSSLFCKCPKVKIIIRRLQRIWTDWAKGVYRRSFCVLCVHVPCCELPRWADTPRRPAPWRFWCRVSERRRRNLESSHLAARTQNNGVSFTY